MLHVLLAIPEYVTSFLMLALIVRLFWALGWLGFGPLDDEVQQARMKRYSIESAVTVFVMAALLYFQLFIIDLGKPLTIFSVLKSALCGSFAGLFMFLYGLYSEWKVQRRRMLNKQIQQNLKNRNAADNRSLK